MDSWAIYARAVSVPCPKCEAPQYVGCNERALGAKPGEIQGTGNSICFRRLAEAGLKPEDAPDEEIAHAIREGIDETGTGRRTTGLVD